MLYLDCRSACRTVSLIQNYIAVICQDLPSRGNKYRALKIDSSYLLFLVKDFEAGNLQIYRDLDEW